MWPFSTPPHLYVSRRKVAAREEALRVARLRPFPPDYKIEAFLRATGSPSLLLFYSFARVLTAHRHRLLSYSDRDCSAYRQGRVDRYDV